MQVRVITAFLLLALPCAGSAATIRVDPSGGGDYLSLPWAWVHASSGDTILMCAGVHYVASVDTAMFTWPIPVRGPCPPVIGEGDPDEVILLGDGSTDAFVVTQYTDVPTLFLQGMTFTGIDKVIVHSYSWPYYLTFLDNIVEGCGGGVSALDASGVGASSVIAGNVIRNNQGGGIYIYHNSGLIEGNEIYGNGWSGIEGGCCETPTIRDNHIHHNNLHGVWTGFYGDIAGNIIEHNGQSGVRVGSSCQLVGNTIRFNRIGIEHWGSFGLAHENDIYGNVDHNALFSSPSAGEVDMTMNWWGVADSTAIAATIYDCSDDPSVGTCARFVPFCTSPGCGASSASLLSWGAIKALFQR